MLPARARWSRMRSRLSTTGRRVVIVGDLIPERLAQAKSFGCEIVDVSKDASVGDQIAQILKVPEVDCAVDCVGFEARGHGHDAKNGNPGNRAEFADGDLPRGEPWDSPGCT